MTRPLARLAALALLVLAGPAAAQSTADPRTPLLFDVAGAEGEAARLTLLGSIHVLDADAYPLPDALDAAYAAADVVAFEIDVDDTEGLMRAMAQHGVRRDGRPLREVIGKATHLRLEAVLARSGISAAMVRSFEPWAVALMLRSLAPASDYRAALGVDRHYFDRAHADGKETVALETPADQVALFAAPSEREQVAALRALLKLWDAPADEVAELVAAWGRGDEAEIEAVTRAMPEAERRALLDDRNAAWMPHLETLLARDERVLVVVGAAHLVGEGSLVANLRERGYAVTRR